MRHRLIRALIGLFLTLDTFPLLGGFRKQFHLVVILRSRYVLRLLRSIGKLLLTHTSKYTFGPLVVLEFGNTFIFELFHGSELWRIDPMLLTQCWSVGRRNIVFCSLVPPTLSYAKADPASGNIITKSSVSDVDTKLGMCMDSIRLWGHRDGAHIIL